MDLTPAMGKLYLARVNPLLGEIVGPAIGEEDLPDVTVYVAPAGFVLPADEYSIRIEPLRATLAKGQLVDGVLSLVSRQDLAKGRAQLTMQTSPIEATVNANGNLACSRMDLLIAGINPAFLPLCFCCLPTLSHNSLPSFSNKKTKSSIFQTGKFPHGPH
jgi:hypothetical protein